MNIPKVSNNSLMLGIQAFSVWLTFRLLKLSMMKKKTSLRIPSLSLRYIYRNMLALKYFQKLGLSACACMAKEKKEESDYTGIYIYIMLCIIDIVILAILYFLGRLIFA